MIYPDKIFIQHGSSRVFDERDLEAEITPGVTRKQLLAGKLTEYHRVCKSPDEAFDYTQELEAENARLREALQEIADMLKGDLPITRLVKKIAQKALDGNE